MYGILTFLCTSSTIFWIYWILWVDIPKKDLIYKSFRNLSKRLYNLLKNRNNAYDIWFD